MARTGRLLIVDDEEAALKTLARAMTRDGHDVITAGGGGEALARLAERPFDVLLTDLRMESVDGMQLLRTCKDRYSGIETVVITGYATAEAAVQAMKHGAFYFVAKPYRLTDVRRVVGEALEKAFLRAENERLRSEVEAIAGMTTIVTQDAGMRQLLAVARQVAPTDCNVLIEGESGTGKELFARQVHQASGRTGPYVAVNCGAFNPDLLANELFGHEKAAYTGAAGERKGLVEAADGGTLFLDEITEMSSDMQVKLLRVIQEREVMRLGATVPVTVDVRVVAATNRDLADAVGEGRLRHDLYYRLNVVTLKVPPLRERVGDIPLLIAHFVRKFAARMRKAPLSVAPDVVTALQDYDFPGNVRELENIVERGVVLANGQLFDLEQLPKELLRQAGAVGTRRTGGIATLEEQERRYIRWVLAETAGNQTTAARLLGIDRSSLWRKLKSYQNGEL